MNDRAKDDGKNNSRFLVSTLNPFHGILIATVKLIFTSNMRLCRLTEYLITIGNKLLKILKNVFKTPQNWSLKRVLNFKKNY